VVGDPPGERLGTLAQQRRRGAAQDQEAGLAPRAVHQHPEDLEEVGAALDLVDDDKPGQALQRQHRFGQAREVIRIIEVEPVSLLVPRIGEGARQGGLSDLARTENRHDGMGAEEPRDLREVRRPIDHTRRIS
jgi:hypothetical protein